MSKSLRPDFFPTYPGPAALVTMPDLDTGQRGTGVVQVISLNVDGNHDGTMDFNYFGPDQTTPNHPYRFWVNDNHETAEDSGDDVPGQGSGVADGQTPAFYSDTFTPVYQIRGVRDLVDFFPVYLNIVKGSVLP